MPGRNWSERQKEFIDILSEKMISNMRSFLEEMKWKNHAPEYFLKLPNGQKITTSLIDVKEHCERSLAIIDAKTEDEYYSAFIKYRFWYENL